MQRPAWLQGWRAAALLALVALLVLYGAYAAFVSYSNGTDRTLAIEVGTEPSGHMYLRCAAGSDPEVCSEGSSTFTVHQRDRVHVRVVNRDGGSHTHDIRLLGAPYWLYPAGFENELDHCPTSATCVSEDFTAWSAGTFSIVCELSGHEAAGMTGTLVVQ